MTDIKHRVHFQRVPSHLGIDSDEKADFLTRTAAEEGWRNSPWCAWFYCAHLSFRDLGTEMHEQMFRSGGRSDVKSSSVWFPSRFGGLAPSTSDNSEYRMPMRYVIFIAKRLCDKPFRIVDE
ncbi:hypothetical protein TNCV_4367261 [Trichonephila clavipes]|nr:hypothetical protein TNCV_4367261 [Trichonephila clavipes]